MIVRNIFQDFSNESWKTLDNKPFSRENANVDLIKPYKLRPILKICSKNKNSIKKILRKLRSDRLMLIVKHFSGLFGGIEKNL